MPAIASATLTVTSPSGTQSRVPVDQLPFRIGRLGQNHLALRDSRISRHHAQIVLENEGYAIEDLNSRYGVFVNGKRITRQTLNDADRIDFGFPDSYQITFTTQENAGRPAQVSDARHPALLGGGDLAKLRAMLEVARALQSSLSTDEILGSVIDAALAVTGCERGFLLLKKGEDLQIRIARDRDGPLPSDELRIPTRMLLRALQHRRELLSMSFDPSQADGPPAERTIAALELRSVVCVPLVRIRTGNAQETATLSPINDTVGLLYLDSRIGAADLSSGGRELVTTLALEASTVLENARLLEEQWERQRIDDELRVARRIQQSLLPKSMPSDGWFRAAGSSLPSLEVGGDYMDIRRVSDRAWNTVMADVSGKGVGAAILASLLQGLFLAAPYSRIPMDDSLFRINRFLNERTGGEQYATLFYCTMESGGGLTWTNAGHLPPLIVRADSRLEGLPASGMPLGLLEDSTYTVVNAQLRHGEKVVIFTDGMTEAQNSSKEFFGIKRLRDTIVLHAGEHCGELHSAILAAVERFTDGTPQNDDITVAVIEYCES